MAKGRNQEVLAERTWLGVGVSLGIGGGALIASTAAASLPVLSNPALYIGGVFFLIASYVGLGVFVPSIPLPKLPSERSAERFHGRIDRLLTEGLSLEIDVPVSEAEWETWQRHVTDWANRAAGWLSTEVSNAQALAFAKPTPAAGRFSNSYNSAHNHQRLVLRWRLEWLHRLKDSGP